jgi:hypothetical protein
MGLFHAIGMNAGKRRSYNLPTAMPLGFVPAAKGEPKTVRSLPLCPSILKTETSLELKFAT